MAWNLRWLHKLVHCVCYTRILDNPWRTCAWEFESSQYWYLRYIIDCIILVWKRNVTLWRWKHKELQSYIAWNAIEDVARNDIRNPYIRLMDDEMNRVMGYDPKAIVKAFVRFHRGPHSSMVDEFPWSWRSPSPPKRMKYNAFTHAWEVQYLSLLFAYANVVFFALFSPRIVTLGSFARPAHTFFLIRLSSCNPSPYNRGDQRHVA